MGETPQAPYFDSDLGVWVLSRFSDVSTALHHPELWPVGPNGEGQLEVEDRNSQAKRRSHVLAELHAGKIADWKSEFAPVADRIVTALPLDRSIDVLGEFARPWCVLLAAKVVGIDAGPAQSLVALAAKVTASTADPDNPALKAEAAAAGAALDKAFVDSRLPMAGPAFIALSQTLPCLLANAWLTLLNYPEEMERIRANSDLLPKAVEELLRLAGLARVLHRQAIADVKLGEILIECGQRVSLMLAIANYDPEEFAQPDRLDLSRRTTGHFALGASEHSCAAASLIRMAMGVATGIFVGKFIPAEQPDPVAWLGGSGFRWPAAVYARRRPERD
jgi:cytochrome P450